MHALDFLIIAIAVAICAALHTTTSTAIIATSAAVCIGRVLILREGVAPRP